MILFYQHLAGSNKLALFMLQAAKPGRSKRDRDFSLWADQKKCPMSSPSVAI